MTIKDVAVRFVQIGNRLIEEGLPDAVVAKIVMTIFRDVFPVSHSEICV